MVEWQHDPIGWAERFLGIPAHTLRWSLNPGYEDHTWDGTPDPIAAMFDSVVEWENVGLESGTGTGKSFGLAVLTLWFVGCFPQSKAYSYAPKENQLRAFMWAEIAELFPRFKRLFPSAELTDLRIRMIPGSDKWGAQGYSVRIRKGEKSATAAQGPHAKYMLLIIEEGPGVVSPIWTALENTCLGPYNIRVGVGNPDAQDDPLHQFAVRSDVVDIRASALDHPNVVCNDPEIVPGAVSRRSIAVRKELYAGTPQLYGSRVRGISPEYAYGLALAYRDKKHLETWALGQLEVAHKQKWRWYAGIDFGAWRFSFVLAAVDRAKRVHVVDEIFSGFGETLATRAEEIVRLLWLWGVPLNRLKMVGDNANQTDIIELNAAFRKLETPDSILSLLGKREPSFKATRLRCSGVKMSDKARSTAVEKLNMLLGQRALLFRRGMGEGKEWRLGASTVHEGHPMKSSRLLYELKHWRYPEPGENEAQDDSPDDDSADGADAISALRYLVMTWIRAASFDKPLEQNKPNTDHGLTDLQRRLREAQREAITRTMWAS